MVSSSESHPSSMQRSNMQRHREAYKSAETDSSARSDAMSRMSADRKKIMLRMRAKQQDGMDAALMKEEVKRCVEQLAEAAGIYDPGYVDREIENMTQLLMEEEEEQREEQRLLELQQERSLEEHLEELRLQELHDQEIDDWFQNGDRDQTRLMCPVCKEGRMFIGSVASSDSRGSFALSCTHHDFAGKNNACSLHGIALDSLMAMCGTTCSGEKEQEEAFKAELLDLVVERIGDGVSHCMRQNREARWEMLVEEGMLYITDQQGYREIVL